MNDDEIPDPHHVMRHVPPNRQMKDEFGNVVAGIRPDAFLLRPEDHGRLSVTWLEYFPGPHTEQRVAAVKAIRASRDVRPSHGFAVGQVGAIKACCNQRQRTVRIVHEPKDSNKAHASVVYMPADDMLLLEELATNHWSSVVYSRDVEPGAVPAPDQSAYKPK